MTTQATRRALASLEGLSVGDAFGERMFVRGSKLLAGIREVPTERPWRWTDDTAMALSVVEVLLQHGSVDRDALAQAFAHRYRKEPWRGYGGMAHEILGRIGAGVPWQAAAGAAFGGRGSMGNGSAMRVAPVGAFFAGDPARAATEASASADPTHLHPEGRAGAVAVAVAAAVVSEVASGDDLFARVLPWIPPGEVRTGVEAAAGLGDVPVMGAALAVGNGSRITCPDTVPFTLWCVSRHLDDYAEALWSTVSGLGDIDTSAAIVGGILATRLGVGAIPAEWRAAREPLPTLG